MFKTSKPTESPSDPDPVSRLERVLDREGFETVHEEDAWSSLGETVWSRAENVLFARGETVVILIEHSKVDAEIVDQATRGITELFRARSRTRRALSVFQTTTVYVCIVAEKGSPSRTALRDLISVAGGAVIIPIVVIPDHNSVIYPDVSEERPISQVRKRVEYLQYLLGELSDPVEIHLQTIRTFWLSVAFAVTIAVIAILSAVF